MMESKLIKIKRASETSLVNEDCAEKRSKKSNEINHAHNNLIKVHAALTSLGLSTNKQNCNTKTNTLHLKSASFEKNSFSCRDPKHLTCKSRLQNISSKQTESDSSNVDISTNQSSIDMSKGINNVEKCTKVSPIVGCSWWQSSICLLDPERESFKNKASSSHSNREKVSLHSKKWQNKTDSSGLNERSVSNSNVDPNSSKFIHITDENKLVKRKAEKTNFTSSTSTIRSKINLEEKKLKETFRKTNMDKKLSCNIDNATVLDTGSETNDTWTEKQSVYDSSSRNTSCFPSSFCSDSVFAETPITSMNTNSMISSTPGSIAIRNGSNQVIIYECSCDQCMENIQPLPSNVQAAPPSGISLRDCAIKRKKKSKAKRFLKGTCFQSTANSNESSSSKNSRNTNWIHMCLNCLEGASDSSSSGGSDSDNEDCDGSDEEVDFVEHGERVSADEDSGGGDSGSESDDCGSFDSAEIYEGPCNALDVKQELEDNGSNGPASVASDDMDSLVELRELKCKNMLRSGGDFNDYDDTDDDETDNDESDLWDIFSIYDER